MSSHPHEAELPAYPAGLRLSGRRVLVVGAGRVVQRRLPALLAAGADLLVVAPEATATVEALAEAGRIRLERRGYTASDLDGAWYAMTATDDPSVNARVSADAEARRIWCVRSDDASAATAWTPASGSAGGVTVAVLAGGDHRRSAAVRDSVLHGLRTGTPAEPAVPGARRHPAGVALVGGGPGDPELITVRGRRLLAEADVVVADHLAPQALLAELRPEVELIDAAKLPYGRSMAQQAINELLIDRAREGAFVVRLKGGDPYVFGRGMEEALACAKAGVRCTVVPGVSSAVSVPGAAGIPVTHRGVAHEFTVVSGHLAPNDERSLVDWPALARLRGTLVVLMGVTHIAAIARELTAHGRSADTPVAMVQEGTLGEQRRIDATLGTVGEAAAEHAVRPPTVTVIGEVVAVAG
jgi:uroporphyrin-III C-methyltransferase/precorrin-2 dehydrogenase/sirohydrochlorin ferrochelatase